MKRVRWLGAQLPGSLSLLASKMKANPFTKESQDGFVVERTRETNIEASYIEKISFQEIIKDPFGNEQVFDLVDYRQIFFNLFSDLPHIELIDPPRSTQTLFSKLLELNDFDFSIKPLSVNLVDWAEIFHISLNSEMVIDSIQIAGFEIERGVNAKILIRGDKDVRKALFNFTEGKKYVLEKLQVKIRLDREFSTIHLGNNATAKIPEDKFEDLLPLLRSSLPVPKINEEILN